MTKLNLTRRVMLAAAASTLSFGAPAFADGHQVLDSIHFLIPGGAGGGWDGTARGTGEALMGAGLVGTASYDNIANTGISGTYIRTQCSLCFRGYGTDPTLWG